MNSIAWLLLGAFIGGIVVLIVVKGNINKTIISGRVKQKKTTGSLQSVTNSISKREQKKALRKEKPDKEKNRILQFINRKSKGKKHGKNI